MSDISRFNGLIHCATRPLMTIALCLGVILVCAADADKVAEFENTIRPLLMKHCIECHGPTKSESGLRPDSRFGMLKGGVTEPAVLPGRPKLSRGA